MGGGWVWVAIYFPPESSPDCRVCVNGKTARSSRKRIGSNDELTSAASLPIVLDRRPQFATWNRDTSARYVDDRPRIYNAKSPRALLPRSRDRIALSCLTAESASPSTGDLGDGSETLGHTYRRLIARTPWNARQHTCQSSHAELRATRYFD